MAADRDELITPGGIRLVGRAKDLVSDAALAGLAPPGETDLLFAARFDVRPRLGTGVLPPCLDVLSRVIGKYFPEARSLDRSQDQRQRLGRALAFEWQTVQVEERWTGELLWRTPHPILRGALLTIQAILTDQPGRVNLTIRSGVAGGLSGAFGPVGCGQSVPSFLPEFNRLVRLVYGGRDGTPRALGADDIEGLVRDVLLSETRDVPTALLSPTESGEYLVPPEQLADELLGLAHLYVMDRHSTTYRLTDALGDRRLSCYWGALRIYQPGFSCADSPHDHPLVFGERLLDPLARAQLVGELALKSRRTVPEPPGVEELRRQLTVTAAPPGPVPLPASSLPEPPSLPVTAPDGPILLTPGGVSAELAAQTALLVQMLEVNRRLLEEMVSLRTGNAVRGSAAAALDRRLAMLERMLAGGRPADPGGGTLAEARESRQPEGNEPEPVTLESVVREAAVTLDEDLLIADPAILAAAQSPFQDVERAAAVLDAMALVSRQRQAGTLGRSLREAFRELGVDYRPGIAETTSARLREQYRVRLADGQEVEATEHIAVGNSYDPRYCLRIYFSSRVSAEPRFVVAHVGRHHEVGSST